MVNCVFLIGELQNSPTMLTHLNCSVNSLPRPKLQPTNLANITIIAQFQPKERSMTPANLIVSPCDESRPIMPLWTSTCTTTDLHPSCVSFHVSCAEPEPTQIAQADTRILALSGLDTWAWWLCGWGASWGLICNIMIKFGKDLVFIAAIKQLGSIGCIWIWEIRFPRGCNLKTEGVFLVFK